MARPSLFLMLLGASASGVLGQSSEPSPYDSSVATDDASCTTCSSGCTVTLEQTGTTTATATATAGAVSAYLADTTGTVLAYTTSPGTSISFDFSETTSWEDFSYPGAPSGLVAHVVYASSCSSSAMMSTWDAILDDYMSSDESTFGSNTTATSGGAAPTATVSSASVLTGGDYSITFPEATGSVLFWVRDQSGTLLYLKDGGSPVNGAKTFPAGTTSLEYCEATSDTVSCGTTSIVPSYISSLEGGTTSNVLRTTIQDTDGTYVIAPDTTALSDCETYSIYVKATSGASDALGFAFSAAVEVTAALPFYTYVQCGSSTTVYWSEVTTSDVTAFAPSGFSQEVTVDHPACEGNYADGVNVTVDGRDCRCDKGTLFCDAEDVGSYFRLSNDEAVGIALSVSVIVILLLLALIFLCLKKTAQNQEIKTVLATNTKGEDRL